MRLAPIVLVPAALAAMLFARPAAAANANVLDGVWEGGYVCAQGRTYLRLTLDGATDGAVAGIFHFGSVAWDGGQNTSVPDGDYAVAGRFDGDGRVVLRGVRWINQPSGYAMVDLAGVASRQGQDDVIEGVVTGAPGCTTFYVRRK